MMIDLRCLSCGTRFGFFDDGESPPKPCPNCGKIPKGFLSHRAMIQEIITLTSLHARAMTSAQIKRAREISGLTETQAAIVLDVTKDTLRQVEAGIAVLEDDLAERMDKAYGLGKV
jgi:DNA-binding XRE family transcriptional regulator